MGQGPRLGQWSVTRIAGGFDLGDKRNPIEAIHVSADPNGDGNPQDSQLYTGTWRVRVKRGSGGATPGVITKIDAPSEDVNGNYRLDAGEDIDADGLLDAGASRSAWWPRARCSAPRPRPGPAARTCGPPRGPLSTSRRTAARTTWS
jgi:hypothetical protein